MFVSNYYSMNRAARQIAESNDRVADAMLENSRQTAASNRQIAASNDRLAATLRDNSAKEIEARNRVDITLAEYMRMREDIANLKAQNQRLTSFFQQIGLPIDLPIVPGSIQKYVCSGPVDWLDFNQGFSIHFKCDMSQMTREQRSNLTEKFIHAN